MSRKPAGFIVNYVEIPREILESPKDLEVWTEIMFVSKLPFLVSIIRGLKIL